MMMRHAILALVAAAGLVGAAWGAVSWQTEPKAAYRQARAESKAVLALFTGSDWCTWCVELKKNVLSAPEFKTFLANHFVGLEIDIPRDASRVSSKEALQRNVDFARRQYGISTFPTVLVLSARGYVAGGFVGSADMPEARDALQQALGRLHRLEDAEKLPPEKQARELRQVYESLPEELRKCAALLRDAIIELSPEVGRDLLRQRQVAYELARIDQEWRRVQHDEAAALALIDREIARSLPENVEVLQQRKLNIIQLRIYTRLNQARTEADVLEVKRMMLEDFLPEIPAEDREDIRRQMELEFANPAEVIRSLQAA